MKKFLIVVGIILICLAAGLGIWGYLKAQEIKKQGDLIERATSETTSLEMVKQDQIEISLLPWKNLAENSSRVLDELENVDFASADLREKIGEFYSAQAKDKYHEAKYMQVLIETQRKLDLKNQQPKSKGQIESILTEFSNMQNIVTENNLSLGPKFNTTYNKVEQEAMTFKSSLTDLSGKMNSQSSPVQLSSAGFDKSVDELKQEIANSLNEWVDLQNEIRNQIGDMKSTNWIMPL